MEGGEDLDDRAGVHDTALVSLRVVQGAADDTDIGVEAPAGRGDYDKDPGCERFAGATLQRGGQRNEPSTAEPLVGNRGLGHGHNFAVMEFVAFLAHLFEGKELFPGGLLLPAETHVHIAPKLRGAEASGKPPPIAPC